ncbi:hypothetical protein BSK56_09370 [Paenibacillus borealis]|uniref:ABC transporter permease n=1 Tax=Paenibacillus borealis TaxID=160799 RepID=A0ABX3HJG1_PAEBO|nr:ABC-2 family transporter protein [Paenibacillus borealis]OMD49551.1 hypothetical protein BSK56_09370 [Paenibacillus borealis]
MNIRGGIAMIRGQLFNFMSEKGFFWTLALGWMIGPVIYMIVWSTAASSGTIGGYDRNAFVLYYLCLILINQMTYPTTHWSTAQAIHNGSISSALLRPLPLIYGAVGQEAAVKMVCIPFVAVVVTLLGLLLGVQASFTFVSIAAGLAALMLALMIRFLLAYILSLLAFWTQHSSALLSVNDTFIFLFGGQVAPLALFPGQLNQLTHFLPYRYMISFPVEALMGTLHRESMIRGFTMQLLWTAVLMLVCYGVNRYGQRKYSAVGG